MADQLGRLFDDKERTAVYAALGSGDDRAAVHRLIHIAAEHRHPLPARTCWDLHVWAHAHDAADRYAPVLARIKDPLDVER
ncbi:MULTISPECIES: hypothetical protein [Nocardiaceae]|uniref:HEAT repeat domain-containing protein n=1 Tax=Rhodococcoides corynebacterioides TaxID=53972 RepID=A0ABS2KZI8_9NOCA|nr:MULTISPECIES: hypothetical protein [Rhodococcus]MBM7417358.1 hypothetical protein [Rhodococcus corynebacterioides]MBP1115611.1 hypothetical protein [Rhodococcus sp. PvP016]